MRTHVPRRWWEIGLAIAIVVIAAAMLIVRGLTTAQTPGSPVGPSPPATSSSLSTAPSAPPAPAATPALAVKIDNVTAARPATGLGTADVIYVEPVEGGLTRLVAVYLGTPPDVVGPVRSARGTDIELLGQHGKPVLAYSGAAPQLLPALHAANLINASPAEAPGAYYRDNRRAAPHNLYLHPRRLPGGAVAPAVPALRFGPVGTPGAASNRHDTGFRAARFTFVWAPDAKRWLVSMDGAPMTSTESGQLSAATVVELRVGVTVLESIEDATGQVSPVAHTVGQGRATILRDGQRFDGTWSRPAASAPTVFHTGSGAPLPLAPVRCGSCWCRPDGYFSSSSVDGLGSARWVSRYNAASTRR